jgi:hypothetical protein
VARQRRRLGQQRERRAEVFGVHAPKQKKR